MTVACVLLKASGRDRTLLLPHADAPKTLWSLVVRSARKATKERMTAYICLAQCIFEDSFRTRHWRCTWLQLRDEKTKQAIRIVLVAHRLTRVERLRRVPLRYIFRPLVVLQFPKRSHSRFLSKIIMHCVQSLSVLLIGHVFHVLQPPRVLRLLEHKITTLPPLDRFAILALHGSCHLGQDARIYRVVTAAIWKFLLMKRTEIMTSLRLSGTLGQER